MAKKKKKIPVKGKTYVALILDSSGSMYSIRDEVVSAYNAQIKTIQEEAEKNKVPTEVSIITFNTTPHTPQQWCVEASKVRPIDMEEYKPEGLTALFDTVGKVVEDLSEHENEDNAFLVCIVTDGFENNSLKYNPVRIKELVQGKQDTKHWTFTYLGASDFDLTSVADVLNIDQANRMMVNASTAGRTAGMSAHTGGTQSYFSGRASGQTMSRTFYDEGDKTDSTEK
jgi:uncharacterized protein YegL